MQLQLHFQVTARHSNLHIMLHRRAVFSSTLSYQPFHTVVFTSVSDY